jgi:hypothetical protein
VTQEQPVPTSELQPVSDIPALELPVSGTSISGAAASGTATSELGVSEATVSELAVAPVDMEQVLVGAAMPPSYRFADIPENRPIFADEQTYRYADLPDERPIFVAQTYNTPPQFAEGKSGPSGRPVSVSQELPIAGVSLPFKRPLFSSPLTSWPTFTLSGERPVAPSSLQVQHHPYLPNGRPMGSNHIDDYQDLMGFID